MEMDLSSIIYKYNVFVISTLDWQRSGEACGETSYRCDGFD